MHSDIEIALSAFNAETGQIRYWNKADITSYGDLCRICRASSSLPVVMPSTYIDGQPYIDGGVHEGFVLEPAIAAGIKESLETIQETGVGNAEANQLFMFTQWTEMMSEFAKTGKASTVVLPSDFSQTAGMFEQMVAASSAGRDAGEPPAPAAER